MTFYKKLHDKILNSNVFPVLQQVAHQSQGDTEEFNLLNVNEM